MSNLLKKAFRIALLTSLVSGLSACASFSSAKSSDYSYVPSAQAVSSSNDLSIADF